MYYFSIFFIFAGVCRNLIGEYRCDCLQGWFGVNCEDDGNQCANSPCQNGATCVDLFQAYRCQCIPGYQGIVAKITEIH